MKNRNEIDEKFKWNFSLLFKNDEEIKDAIKESKEKINNLKLFEGKLNTKENVLKFFTLSDSLEQIISKLDLYAMMIVDVDTTNAKALLLAEEVSNLLTYYSVSLAFVGPELSKIDDNLLDEMINDSDFTDYDRTLEEIKRDKPHTLTTEKEKLLAGIGEFTDFNDTYSKLVDAEINFEPIVDENGEKFDLSEATYRKYSMHENRNYREQASVNLMKGYSNFNLTISSNYIAYLKKQKFLANTYNFKSALDKALFYEEVDQSVYKALIKNISKYIPNYQNYLKKKSEILGLSDFSIYDVNAPLGDGSKFSLDYNGAVKLVLDVVKVFGEEYLNITKRNFDERWVDVYPNKAKRSGAYSASVFGTNPFMLLNYESSYRSVSTIAHELGHSLHSYFSESYQPQAKANYVIFVAEVASTVNEILLAKHILKLEKSEEVRKYIIESLISEFSNTVFRQTMFSEFEEFAHGTINNGAAITYEELNGEYENLLKKYFGGGVKLHEYSKFEWSRIPHFYRAFYVYKYATGFIAAVNIVSKIESMGEDYIKNHYIKFLSSGCKADPVSLLKIAGIDMTSDKTYKTAFEFYDSLVKSL